MDTTLFRQLGLTERETKVYLALLELGSSTAGPLTAKSGIPHTKVYETLARLNEKGLVSSITVSKTKHYEAASPKELLNILEERKRQFSDIIDELELKRKFAQTKQVATVHEGYAAFKALFNRISDELQKQDSYCAFAFKEDYRSIATPLFLRNFHRKLAEKKVIDKAIASFEVKRDVLKAFEGNSNIQLRFVKKTMPVGMIIIKDKVIQLVWGDRPTAIEITSSQIHEHYLQFFDETWNEAK